MTTIPTFDPPVKLHSLPIDTILNFSYHVFQPFATTTIDFVVIRVHGEINNKSNILVADRSSPEDIQIVSF